MYVLCLYCCMSACIRVYVCLFAFVCDVKRNNLRRKKQVTSPDVAELRERACKRLVEINN